MPFPILHSYAGYAIYKLAEDKSKSFQWGTAFWAIFIANLADFDFLPGVLLQDAALFHREASHSFFAAFACGLIFGLAQYLFKKENFLKTFFIATAAYMSHLMLDFFTGSLALLWPISDAHFGLNHYFLGESPFMEAKNVLDFLIGMLSPAVTGRMFKELLAVLFCLLMTYIAQLVSKQIPVKLHIVHSTTFGIGLLYISVILWGAI